MSEHRERKDQMKPERKSLIIGLMRGTLSDSSGQEGSWQKIELNDFNCIARKDGDMKGFLLLPHLYKL